MTALNVLQGRFIFQGCCKMIIEFSTLPNLHVKYNDSKSCDFTVNAPPAPSGNTAMVQQQASPPSKYSNIWNRMPDMSGLFLDSSGYSAYVLKITSSSCRPSATSGMISSGISTSSGRCVLHVSNLDQVHVTPDVLHALFSTYGDVLRIKVRDVVVLDLR